MELLGPLTVPLAAATEAVFGVPQAVGHPDSAGGRDGCGLALLFPVLQYALDLLALRRMTPTTFGTLMSLEPAIGLVLGLVILSQHPSPLQLAAITLVVLAGAGAQRGGRRPATADPAPDPLLRPLTSVEPR